MTDARFELARDQLGRMRGMTAMYHRRFYNDVWLTGTLYLVVLTAGHLGAQPVFAALPFIALFGAVITAFDASYLMLARHYAVRLERYLDDRTGGGILVGGALEDGYLFPLGVRKVVTIATGAGFTWFGWVTVVFTFLGVVGYVLGLVLAVQNLSPPAVIWLVASLAPPTIGSVAVGLWWFVAGTGERRLEDILDRVFVPDRGRSTP
jgi:hypothetical protein